MGRPCPTEPKNDAAVVLLLLLAFDSVGERIDVVEEPKRVYSSFIKGYETLPVRIAA